MKYFLLGAFSSGFFVYGIALVYGYAGVDGLRARSPRPSSAGTGSDGLLLGGIAPARGRPAVQGRRRAVPRLDARRLPGRPDRGHRVHGGLHQGRRVRRAAAAVLRRLRRRPRWDWTPMIWVVAILTMVVGSVLALTQTDIKRLLAYSSIAHAGFMLTGFLGVRSLNEVAGGEHHRRLGGAVLPDHLRLHRRWPRSRWSPSSATAAARPPTSRAGPGWARSRRSWPGMFAFLLLGMAGIPLTSGFTGKWAVFAAALSAGAWPVVIVGGAGLGRGGVLLRPGDRADVLLRARRRGPERRRARAC